MEKFSVVPTLKSLSAKTILRHNIPVIKKPDKTKNISTPTHPNWPMDVVIK